MFTCVYISEENQNPEVSFFFVCFLFVTDFVWMVCGRIFTPVAITSSMSIMFKYEPPNEFRVGREGEFYFTRHLSKLPAKISLEWK